MFRKLDDFPHKFRFILCGLCTCMRTILVYLIPLDPCYSPHDGEDELHIVHLGTRPFYPIQNLSISSFSSNTRSVPFCLSLYPFYRYLVCNKHGLWG